MGLPTVGFDVPGVREAVRHDETGFLVPFKDINALTTSVSSLLDNPNLRETMGRAARAMVEAEFDRQVIEDRYFQVYKELGFDV